MDFTELRKAVEEVELVDAHAHNIVSLHSNFSFIHAFSEANGEALTFSPNSLSFKVTSLLESTLFTFASSMFYCCVGTTFIFNCYVLQTLTNIDSYF